jgi:hypothetical protein
VTAALKAANLALKFALELAALAAFAYWGATVASGALAVILAVVLPTAMAVLWGRFAAPRAARRLPLAPRVVFEMSVFGLAAVALAAAGSPILAAALAVTTVANAALLTAWGQWEM